jgi:hypothetical protein
VVRVAAAAEQNLKNVTPARAGTRGSVARRPRERCSRKR